MQDLMNDKIDLCERRKKNMDCLKILSNGEYFWSYQELNYRCHLLQNQ
jgi:hypothetical protein